MGLPEASWEFRDTTDTAKPRDGGRSAPLLARKVQVLPDLALTTVQLDLPEPLTLQHLRKHPRPK